MAYHLEATHEAAERAASAIAAWKAAGEPKNGPLIAEMRYACSELDQAEAYDETWD